jgi:ferredoxin
MFGRTYAVIMAKKTRMCARFGHVRPRYTFRTFSGATAGYCQRCGECVRVSE